MMGPKMVFTIRALSGFWIALVIMAAYAVETEVPYDGEGLGISIFTALLMIFPATMVLKFVKSAPVEDA